MTLRETVPEEAPPPYTPTDPLTSPASNIPNTSEEPAELPVETVPAYDRSQAPANFASATGYFADHPPPTPHAPEDDKLEHVLTIYARSQAKDYSRVPRCWRPRSEHIKKRDWEIFIKYLLPPHLGLAASHPDAELPDKLRREIALDRKDRPQETDGQRKRRITTVIDDWNRCFFGPRGMRIACRFAPEDGTMVTSPLCPQCYPSTTRSMPLRHGPPGTLPDDSQKEATSSQSSTQRKPIGDSVNDPNHPEADVENSARDFPEETRRRNTAPVGYLAKIQSWAANMSEQAQRYGEHMEKQAMEYGKRGEAMGRAAEHWGRTMETRAEVYGRCLEEQGKRFDPSRVRVGGPPGPCRPWGGRGGGGWGRGPGGGFPRGLPPHPPHRPWGGPGHGHHRGRRLSISSSSSSSSSDTDDSLSSISADSDDHLDPATVRVFRSRLDNIRRQRQQSVQQHTGYHTQAVALRHEIHSLRSAHRDLRWRSRKSWHPRFRHSRRGRSSAEEQAAEEQAAREELRNLRQEFHAMKHECREEKRQLRRVKREQRKEDKKARKEEKKLRKAKEKGKAKGTPNLPHAETFSSSSTTLNDPSHNRSLPIPDPADTPIGPSAQSQQTSGSTSKEKSKPKSSLTDQEPPAPDPSVAAEPQTMGWGWTGQPWGPGVPRPGRWPGLWGGGPPNPMVPGMDGRWMSSPSMGVQWSGDRAQESGVVPLSEEGPARGAERGSERAEGDGKRG